MVESRLKYYADEYYEKDIDLKMSTGKGFDFGKLRDTVDFHIRVLQQKQLMLGPQALKEDSSSTSLVEEPNQGCKREPQRSFSQVVVESPQAVQPTERCNVCGQMHLTRDCNHVLELDLEGRVELFLKRRVCFNCLERGHISKFCEEGPRCEVCPGKHDTLLHGRQRQGQEGSRRQDGETDSDADGWVLPDNKSLSGEVLE